jgi:hypothetical protein
MLPGLSLFGSTGRRARNSLLDTYLMHLVAQQFTGSSIHAFRLSLQAI